ncbi:MAG: pyridoxamine 5'-phosphate oxidase family protein [Nitrosomonadales bacterium]|nr:pyridoxamine 5'-phosphate oxidase family protein [Nitrosomonadales bacterium]
MNPDQATALRDILQTQQIASLGTLHKGEPFVSMVPYAILPDGDGFVIHVSQLATHTKDMLLNPGVSLLVIALPNSEVPAQATARVTIQGQARLCADSTQGYAEAKTAYLSRFPQTAKMFSFADFSLFVIHPSSARFVGGFARATTIAPEVLVNILCKR